MIPTEFLSYMVHMVNLPNPLLIMTEGDYRAMDLCTEIQFAITCIEYSQQDFSPVMKLLLSMQNNKQKFYPIVFSDGNHIELIKALNTRGVMIPIIFGIRIGITHTAMGISWNRNHYCWNHINKGTGSNTGISSISGIRSTSEISSTNNLGLYQHHLTICDKKYKDLYPTTT